MLLINVHLVTMLVYLHPISTAKFMLIPPGALNETFAAISAFVRLFASVSSFVCLHVGLLDEGLAAKSTAVGFVFEMDLFVSFSTAFVWKDFAADGTT